MQWTKWKKNTLPDPGQRVLIAYKNGLVGAIEFFYDQQHKDSYVKAIIWNEQNPKADLGGPIANALKALSDDDSIIAWMPCPKAPNWSVSRKFRTTVSKKEKDDKNSMFRM